MRASWTGNILLKAFALMLALFLWNYYRTEQQAIRFVTVPLGFQDLPANRELSGDIPGTVTVQLQAPEAMVRSLTPDWIDAHVSLSDVGLGQQNLSIGPQHVSTPTGAQVLGVTPDTITVTVESKLRKVLPVEPRIRGEPAEGFMVSEVRLIPTEVTVEGPESEIDRARRAVTDWIVLRGQRATFQEGVRVAPEDARVRLVGARSAIATVEIRPVESPEEEGDGGAEAPAGEDAGS